MVEAKPRDMRKFAEGQRGFWEVAEEVRLLEKDAEGQALAAKFGGKFEPQRIEEWPVAEISTTDYNALVDRLMPIEMIIARRGKRLVDVTVDEEMRKEVAKGAVEKLLKGGGKVREVKIKIEDEEGITKELAIPESELKDVVRVEITKLVGEAEKIEEILSKRDEEEKERLLAMLSPETRAELDRVELDRLLAAKKEKIKKLREEFERLQKKL